MPKRLDTSCEHPGYAKLIPYGPSYCEEHVPFRFHDVKSKKKRDTTMVGIRAEKGRLKKETVVDHIVFHWGKQDV
ncbi:hypothetical protein ACWOMK_27965 [Bacillus thuringiensis]